LAKTTKLFHGIFEIIKCKFRIAYVMLNTPLSGGGLYFISGDPEMIDLNNVIEFSKKLITIFGNPLAYDGEELDINKIKKGVLKDKPSLFFTWDNAFNSFDEDGVLREHSVMFYLDFDNSRYILRIA